LLDIKAIEAIEGSFFNCLFVFGLWVCRFVVACYEVCYVQSVMLAALSSYIILVDYWSEFFL
jgi:hypothetical protein